MSSRLTSNLSHPAIESTLDISIEYSYGTVSHNVTIESQIDVSQQNAEKLGNT